MSHDLIPFSFALVRVFEMNNWITRIPIPFRLYSFQSSFFQSCIHFLSLHSNGDVDV